MKLASSLFCSSLVRSLSLISSRIFSSLARLLSRAAMREETSLREKNCWSWLNLIELSILDLASLSASDIDCAFLFRFYTVESIEFSYEMR